MATDDRNDDFAALLEEYGAPAASRGPAVGDTVKGTVISVGREAVFVDLGAKAEGVLDLDQVSDADGAVTVSVGDEIEARVVSLDGGIQLRRHMARGAEARGELLSAFEHRLPVEGVVTGVNKGGLEVQIAGVRAFCPISQIDNRFVEDAQAFVGQRLSFRITRYEPGRGNQMNLVVSRRALLEEEAAAAAAELRGRLEVGAVLEGTVTSLKPYGAFVDLGGLEGMIHVSELGFRRVDDPSEVVSAGQKVKVQIVKIEDAADPKRMRIGLSLKALEADPWSDAAARFAAGARVPGTVVRLQPFGAFVEIAPGIEGLVHISELGAAKRIHHPREVVREGDRVEVTVLSVDAAARRVSLSMKADAAEAEAGQSEYLSRGAEPGGKGLGTLGDLLRGHSPSDK